MQTQNMANMATLEDLMLYTAKEKLLSDKLQAMFFEGIRFVIIGFCHYEIIAVDRANKLGITCTLFQLQEIKFTALDFGCGFVTPLVDIEANQD